MEQKLIKARHHIHRLHGKVVARGVHVTDAVLPAAGLLWGGTEIEHFVMLGACIVYFAHIIINGLDA